MRPFVHDRDAYAILARSLGEEPAAFEAELARRGDFLASLAQQGICDPVSVAYALADYPSEGAPE